MKILVPVKARSRLQRQGACEVGQKPVSTWQCHNVMNPFDEIAIEEACSAQGSGVATEVMAVSCGVLQCRRPAHGDGDWRDRGIWWRPCGIAAARCREAAKAIVDKEQPQLVIAGKQAIDDDAIKRARCLLRWPTCRSDIASKITIADGRAQVTREVDGGLKPFRSHCRGDHHRSATE